MIVDIDNDDILTADCLGFFLAIPSFDEMVGTINQSNKVFKIANPPLYPAAQNGVLPTKDDITVYSREITTGPPITHTDTKVDVKEVQASDVLQPAIFDQVELNAVPTGDELWASYYELLEPFVAQGVEPKVNQKNTDIARINSTATMTAYGNLKIDIKSEQIMSRKTIQYIRRLMFTESATEPAEGYTLDDLRTKPQKLRGYENIRWENELIGRLYFEDLTIAPDLPNVKKEGQVGFTLQCDVAKAPKLLLPAVED